MFPEANPKTIENMMVIGKVTLMKETSKSVFITSLANWCAANWFNPLVSNLC